VDFEAQIPVDAKGQEARAARSGPAKPLARRLGGALIGFPVAAATLVLFVLLSLLAPSFLTEENILNVLRQAAPLGVVAAGQTLLMISGAFDISVGAVYALSGIVLALLWTTEPVIAIALALAVGSAVGLGNGLAVTVMRVNPFIATLGALLIVRGINLPLTGSGIIFVNGSGFQWIGTSEVAGVPFQVFVFAIVVLASAYVLSATRYGRYLYAIGGNAQAARLAGIRVRELRVSAFVLSGLSAAIAGILHTSEVGAAKSDVGVGLEFSVIAAVVLGGTSLFGGRGSVGRTLVAVCFVAFLQNGFNLMQLAPFYQQAITGLVLLVAVALDGIRHGRRDD
jgi:ribose transport system permease protein